MAWVLNKFFLLLAEKLVAELTFTEGCVCKLDKAFVRVLFIKKCGWDQVGQGQWNVTVWKLVSWNFNGFQVCVFFSFYKCVVCILWYV